MGRLFRLRADSVAFPPADQALKEPAGLLAVGGDLRPERLLAAYRQGIFPWYDDSSPILWWSPDPRMVLEPAQVHVSRSLRKTLRRNTCHISMDCAFDEVIGYCAGLRQESQGTWITEDMQRAYRTLHKLGYAHSVEVWQQQQLVGGLYGIALGRMFFGESMFSLADNASKIAFVALCRQLSEWHFDMIDCQMPTEHLSSLGARPVARTEFLHRLSRNAQNPDQTGYWKFTAEL
ncbi:leucyl/phenylalanyl-tRNA--protein transferase [Pseudohongiella spirulinae]|uniref:Leucyl/phenylalanyl-tRNA--protein transferase n=1 Tax=Pseudohongiella spirulinae TaxID=1249552 RepID=A0A0S2KDF7_9GAMM|nr:leucyl/phenylalanyl-tRNA--protein transferase [Pseudohongiella spirulinae]ALO46213.1 leucyl/phenylalanyl-tRNA--protein transferase [Pseudohongiella spirulinae]